MIPVTSGTLGRPEMSDYHFRNLVFEGGGVKGIAYVGALRELKKRDILKNISRVAGTSAGAINAVLYATGYKPRETTDLLLELDFQIFLDDSWGVVRDLRRVSRKYGWHKGDFFRNWIGERIRAKTGDSESTFADLKRLGMTDLYLVVTNLSTGFSEVMSAEHTPDMPVAEAARMSMSIPLFFTAVRNARNDVYVDGGVLRNYPVKVFDREHYIEPAKLKKHALTTDYYARDNRKLRKRDHRYCYNKETLGFRLDSKQEIALFRDGIPPAAEKIDDFFSYASALLRAFMNVQNNVHLHSDDWQRTVYIDTLGIGATDFDLPDKAKRRLLRSGADGVIEYFDWYDNATGRKRPHNNPRFKPRNPRAS